MGESENMSGGKKIKEITENLKTKNNKVDNKKTSSKQAKTQTSMISTETNVLPTKNRKRRTFITPNQITILRILLIPFMVFFYLSEFIPYSKLIAVVIFIMAAITDFIDGKLARKTGMITDMGKFLDPIADKLLVMSALILVITDSIIIAEWAVWATIIAIIILAREFLVSALRLVAASKNIVMAADNWGKYKTFFQDIALMNFMFIAFLLPKVDILTVAFNIYLIFSYILILIATLLTIISGVNYFIKNGSVLSSKK